MHVDVGQRNERPDMVIGVSNGFAGQLDPCVRQELSVLPPHADAEDRSVDTPSRQHVGEGD